MIPTSSPLQWSSIIEALETLDEAGWTKEQAIDTVAELLDEAIAFDRLAPAPVGVVVEQFDGPAFRALAGLAWDLVHGADPEKRAARKARRAARKALRKARRAGEDIGTEDPTLAG